MKKIKDVPFVNDIKYMIIGDPSRGHLTKNEWNKVLIKLESTGGYLVGGVSEDVKPTELPYPSETNSMFRYLSVGTVNYGDYKGVKIVNWGHPVYSLHNHLYITVKEFLKLELDEN